MSRFLSIMQHPLSAEQVAEARQMADEVVELRNEVADIGGYLDVPTDPELGRSWFAAQARVILTVLGGIQSGDIVLAMGQAQLANAIQAIARGDGARLVEAVTERQTKEVAQADGSVRKTSVFVHKGFRPVYDFSDLG